MPRSLSSMVTLMLHVLPFLPVLVGGHPPPRPREPRLAELRSFNYITTDARGANAERLGVPIRELVHYEMVTASETRYCTF